MIQIVKELEICENPLAGLWWVPSGSRGWVGGSALSRVMYLKQRSYSVRPSVASTFSLASLLANGPTRAAAWPLNSTMTFYHNWTSSQLVSVCLLCSFTMNPNLTGQRATSRWRGSSAVLFIRDLNIDPVTLCFTSAFVTSQLFQLCHFI